MADHGRVIAVGDELLGDEFAEDTLAGATVLQLVDVADFDEAGGRARVGGVVVSYITVDDEAATMTLAAGLLADATAGDHIDAWDIATDTAAIDRIASVVFDGMADGDAIDCVVAQHLRRELPPGIRGEVGESVLIEQDGDEWRVIDVLGLREQAAVKGWQDHYEVAVLGAQTLNLTFEPILHTEHLYWNGDYQPQTEWSRAATEVTVPDVEGYLQVGDELVIEYLYMPGSAAQVPSTTTPVPGDPEFSSGVDNPVTVPGAAAEGDRMLLAIMLPSSIVAASNLNGYTLEAQTANVTAGVHTYRLALYSRAAPSGTIPVPEFPADIKDTPWVLAAWPNVNDITAIELATADSTTTGTSPAPTGPRADVRVWATLSDTFDGIISPLSGDIVASDNDNSQINIVMATGAPTGTVGATCPDDSDWCMATLSLDLGA